MTHYDAFSNRDPNLNPGLNCKVRHVRHVRHTTGRPTLPVDAIRATCVDALMSLDQERINGENIESKASGRRWFRSDQWGVCSKKSTKRAMTAWALIRTFFIGNIYTQNTDETKAAPETGKAQVTG